MKRVLNRICLIFITISLFFVPSLYAKNLVFQADADLNNIRWTTFVKAYSTSSSPNHTDPKVLRDRTGGSAWYLTRYLSFHLYDDSYYNSSQQTSSDVLVYFDDSGTNVISGTNYTNYESLVHKGSTFIKNQDPGHDIKGEFYCSWDETSRVSGSSEYAVEEYSGWGVDSSGNVDKWMRVSTFRLGNSETNVVKERIESLYNDPSVGLETFEQNGLIYAKVRLSNVLSMSTNGNMSNAFQFYYNSGVDWDQQNYGIDYNGNFIKGRSALNNYDNYLLIPFKEVPKNREVYVTYRIYGTNDSNGVFWNDAQSSQSLSDGTVINNLGYVEYDSEYWLEHYSLNPTQRNLNVKYNSNILSKTYAGSLTYQYAGVRVVSGTYDSGMLGSTHTSVEVANEDSTEPIKVTFYYEPKSSVGKNQYLYIKHVNKQTGTSITALKNTETFSPGFKENDLTAISNTLDYQTAYRFKADNITNGGVYKSSKVNSSNKLTINGITYTYNGFRAYIGDTYSSANSNVKTSRLKENEDGWWIGTSNTTKYNVIIFYYTPSGGGEETSGGDPDDLTITGRLAFHTKYTNTSKNVEYVPSSVNNERNYLIPYIEGAKRYLIPYVDESTGESLDDTQSYMKDYAEYRYVKITGSSKSGESSVYNNEYETTGATRNDSEQPISVSSSYTLDSGFSFYSSTNSQVTSSTLRFSNISLDSNGEISFTIRGYESGTVSYYYTRTEDTSKYIKAVPPTKTSEGSPAKHYYNITKHTYKYTWNGTNVNTTTISTSEGGGYEKECPTDGTTTADVPVTYTVTLKQKFRLEHLWVYLIEKTDIQVQQTGTQPRGKVYEDNERFSINTTGTRTSEETNDTSYMGRVRKSLNKYYINYLDTKEKIPALNTRYGYDNGLYKPLSNSDITSNIDYESSNLSKYKVKTDAYNGLRFATAKITYKLYDLANNIYGTDQLYKDYNNNSYTTTNSVTVAANGINENINIFTPIGLTDATVENETGGYVNHSGIQQNGIIQKNAKFTFTPNSKTVGYGQSSINTKNYISYYMVKFDFTISNCKVGGRNIGTLNANTYIRIDNGQSLTGTASNGDESDLVGQFTNKYKILAIAKNVVNNGFVENQINKDSLTNYNFINSFWNAYIDQNQTTRIDNPNTTSTSNISPVSRNGNISSDRNDSNMTEDAHYIVEHVDNTTNLNRIYDFKITDCTDLAYKDVFRTSNSNDINERTETNYYSGTRFWSLDTTSINTMVSRTFNNGFKTIVPLAPYKNTNTTYIFAPKLGYRFSFDLKTTGVLSTAGNSLNEATKKIVIKPSYYFIQKDGQNLNTNIDLYYKNSLGKYVKFTGSGYTIQFKPNDGYRFKNDLYVTNDLSYMSDKLNNLRISDSAGFNLNSNMMATSNNTFIQTWYGEFKLPNSTIAINSGDSPNQSNMLTNGYIGVVFNIEAIDTVNGNRVSISYNKNDLASSNSANTSQWDYEGFLGFDQIGTELTNPINIQLEKGVWSISSDDTYQYIKGTVILYDADARAANDFN